MSTALTSCWVISDGRRGIENQALGLAEALGRLRPLDISRQTITHAGAFVSLPPGLQFFLKSKPAGYRLKAPFPQIAIGCGRQAIAPLRALKKKLGAEIFTVYVQDPRISPKHFDLVIAPEHDRLTGANVETMIGSPNRVITKRLEEGVQQFKDQLAPLPAPRVAVLIGGKSKTHSLSENTHKTHVQAICALAQQGMSVMLTTSRRTPDWAVDEYRKITKDRRHVWVWDGKGENPYFAFLGSADAILVTEDSTNMLTEACATGKPVFTLSMDGQPGKFAGLYEALAQRCYLAPFAGSIESKTYAPLDETARMAGKLLQRLANK